MNTLADYIRDLLIDYERIRTEREGEEVEEVQEMLIYEFLQNIKKLIGD